MNIKDEVVPVTVTNIKNTVLDPAWECGLCPRIELNVMTELPRMLHSNYKNTVAHSPLEIARVAAVLVSDQVQPSAKQEYLTSREQLPVTEREVAAWLPFGYHKALNNAKCPSRKAGFMAAGMKALVYHAKGPLDAVDLETELTGKEVQKKGGTATNQTDVLQIETVIAALLNQYRTLHTPVVVIGDPSKLRVGKRFGHISYIEASSAASAFARVTHTYFSRGVRLVIIWLPEPSKPEEWAAPLKAMVSYLSNIAHLGILILPPASAQPREPNYLAVMEAMKEMPKTGRVWVPVDSFVDEVLAPNASRKRVFFKRFVSFELIESALKFIKDFKPLGHYRQFLQPFSDNSGDNHNYNPPNKKPRLDLPHKNAQRSLGGPSAQSGGR